ncbi:MAG: hypothetical protein WC648_03165 [Candidatus Paceibacterota bacterium]|jgi:hypothetical protein
MKIPKIRFHHKDTEVDINHHKFTHRIWRDPYTDWVVICVITVLLSAYLVYVGFQTFHHMNDNVSNANSSAVQTATIDIKSLTNVLSEFDLKESERKDLLRGYSGPADPSI